MNQPTDCRENVSSQRRLHFEEEDSIPCFRNENTAKEDEVIDLEHKEDVVIENKDVADTNCTIDLKTETPKVGMEFDTEELAFQFYNDYAYSRGFSVRRNNVHKDKNGNILDRVFCCSCEGTKKEDIRDVNVKSSRPQTRTLCKAQLKISARHSSKFKVVKYVAEHGGHNLVSPLKSHILRSHRNISTEQAIQLDDIEKSGIPPKAGLEYMAQQAGGRQRLGFILEDARNYLRSKRTMQMGEGEARGVLNYLQMKQSEDPTFFYAVQVDEDDLITNIFWTDGQMKSDYIYFGDVMSFDTTYKTNKEERPFALFVGVNHHKQTVVFGGALLYDETAETYMWLFDTFAKAMNEKKPPAILTDQDDAMAKALEEKWPETCHRLCIWHIYQNAAKHLNYQFKNFLDFSKDFNACIYDFEEEEDFLEAWQAMLDKYDLQTNEWLEGLFMKKEKWALVYGRETFCANMISTQRSESMNSALKKYVGTKHNLFRFFGHFDRLVDDRRYQEMKADLRTNHSIQTLAFEVQILKHARTVYTHEIFKLFQGELSKGYDSRMEIVCESEDVSHYKITSSKKRCHHNVILYASDDKITCSCKKFEFAGILCSHALKVFAAKNIVKIPELYIKKRWTKRAKKGLDVTFLEPSTMSNEVSMNMKEENEKIRMGKHYKELCRLVNQLTVRASLTDETFEVARNGLFKMLEEIDSTLERKKSVTANVYGVPESSQSVDILKKAENPEITIQGLKRKATSKFKSGKRMKSGLEKAPRKKRLKNNKNSLETNQNLKTTSDNSCPVDIVQSAQSSLLPSLSHNSQSFQVGTSNWNAHPDMGTIHFVNNQVYVPTSQVLGNPNIHPYLGNKAQNQAILYGSTPQMIQWTSSNAHSLPHMGTTYHAQSQADSYGATPQMTHTQTLRQQEHERFTIQEATMQIQHQNASNNCDSSHVKKC